MAAVATEPVSGIGRGVFLFLIGCGGVVSPLSVDVHGSMYRDSDATTVGSTATAVRGRPREDTTLLVRHVVDVTTTASVDVVASATQRWREPRNELAGGITFADGTTTLDVAYVHSRERDWSSHTSSIGFARDFDHHNLTLQVGAAFVHNNVGRASDSTFARRQRVGTATAGLVWVHNPRSIVSLAYGAQIVRGYQESPYRYAYLRSDAPIPLNAPESVPDLRHRHTLTLRWNLALPRTLVLHLHLRAYADNWGVVSATGGFDLTGRLGALLLGVTARGYGQTSASFYRDVYEERQSWMTSDRELATFYDLFAGPRIGARLGERGRLSALRLDLRALGFGFWFRDFSRLPRRRGVHIELGVGMDFR